MKILVAVDDSQYSESVVQSVIHRSWPKDTEFLVVTVLEPIPVELGDQKELAELVEQGTASRRKSAEELCKRVVKTLSEHLSDKKIAFQVREGKPKKEIVDQAEEWCADRILIGAHGHGVCPQNLLGEVSRVVAATAPCSVEIVRESTAGKAPASV